MQDNETVCITWCHHGQVDAYFAHSMMELLRAEPERIKNFNSVQGLGLLAKSRNIQVKYFLDNTDDDWLFIMDSDEYITQEVFNKLVDAADKDLYPVVSGLCFAATFPDPDTLQPVPAIFRYDEKLGLVPFFEYPENSLVEIQGAGTGCLMIHRSVLLHMQKAFQKNTGADWAWFQDGPIPDGLGGMVWISEDLMFSRKLIELGYRLVAHTGALFPHHKEFWLMESHYKTWLEKEKKNLGYHQERPFDSPKFGRSKNKRKKK
jgi:glycosyltransferase involved in cell wall biosynthesis